MNTATLHSTDDAAHQTGLPAHMINRWERDGAITASRPAAGPGTRLGWSERDIAILDAIARVRRDLTHLGFPCPTPTATVARLWTDLHQWGEALLYTATVTITVRLGLED